MSMQTTNLLSSSPYVGPRPFERRHTNLFFGRGREAKDLLARVTANQIVLVYAQSGVGKTSLLNAGLIPLLEKEQFEVLPIARMRGLIPDDVPYEKVSNPFVVNTLISWAPQDTDPRSLLNANIPGYIKSRPHRVDASGFDQARVIIFDQFEELFSFYLDRWEQREEFFQQITQALTQDDLLRVVFVIREDFVAQLDPYAFLLPGKLKSRFRLEPMTPQAALTAVVAPLRGTDRSFAPGAAEKLIEELTKVRVETQEGTTRIISGEFVEPVQLQVVCQNLWQHLPGDVLSIDQQHIADFGDIDQALSKFYEESLALTLKNSKVEEQTLREWFDNVLITSANTRGAVFQGREHTGGIPNRAVAILENQHIIRAELRAGGRWYELTHDRFIEPIQKSNAAWQVKRQESEQQAREQALNEQAQRYRRRVQQQRLVAAVLGMFLLGVGALAVYAFYQRSEAINSEENAQTQVAVAATAQNEALNQAITATIAQGQALNQANNAQTQAAIAATAQGEALLQADNANTQAAAATIAQGQALNQADLAATAQNEAVHQAENANTQAAAATIAQGQALIEAGNAATQAARAQNNAATATIAQGEALLQANNAQTQAALAATAQGEALIQANNANTQAALATAAQGEALLQANNAQTQAAVATVAQGEALLQANNAQTQAAVAATAQNDAIAEAANADIQRETAVAAQAIAQSIALASGALQQLANEQPELAIALALEANQVTEPPPLAYQSLLDSVTYSNVRRRLRGHSLQPTVLDISPDQRFIVSGDADGTVIIWDTVSGEILHTLSGHVGFMMGLKISPDSRLIVSGDSSGNVFVWDLETGKMIQQILSQQTSITGIDFSPDGSYFLTSTLFSIRQWDTESLEQLYRINAPEGEQITAMIHGPVEKSVIYATTLASGAALTMVDFRGLNRVTRVFTAPEARVNTLDINPTRELILAGLINNDLMLWNIDTGSSQTFLQYKAPVYAARFSPDNRFILSASWGSSPVLWDLKTLTVARLFSGESVGINAIDFSSDGTFVITGSGDNTLIQWDMQMSELLGTFQRHNREVSKVAYSPDGTQFVSGDYSGKVFLWNLTTSSFVKEYIGHLDQVSALEFGQDGTTLLSGARDGQIYLWDVDKGVILKSFRVAPEQVLSATLSRDNRYVAASSADNYLRVWDAETQELLAVSPLYTDYVRDVAISPDNRYVIAGSGDKTVTVWDWRANTIIHRLEGHLELVTNVEVSPDGQIIASSAADDTIMLWDMNTGKVLKILRGHRNFVNDIEFSPDGKTLLSGSDDNTLILWDLATGEPLRRFVGHSNWILDVEFSPDGQYALSSSADTSILVWNIAPYPTGLFVWLQANRSVAELSCEQRALYQVEIQCDESGQFPTRTPFPTLIPTFTFTPSPTLDLARVTLTPTSTLTLTPTPVSLISSSLSALGIDLSSGNQVVVRDQINLEFSTASYSWEALGGQYKDFSMGTTFQWGREVEGDYCGFIFHQAFIDSYYLLRLDQTGLLSFTPRVDRVMLRSMNVMLPETITLHRDAPNDLVLVAVGNRFSVYVNGQYAAQFTSDLLSEGELGLLGGNYEAETTADASCLFTNTWLWEFAYSTPVISSPTVPPTYTPTAAPTAPSYMETPLAEADLSLENGRLVNLIPSARIDQSESDNALSSQASFDGNYTDFFIGTTLIWGPGADEDACGVTFRNGPNRNYYTILLTQQGQLIFVSYVDGGQEATLYSRDLFSIEDGEGAENRLDVIASEDTFTVYINGEYADRFIDDTHEEGSVGLMALTLDESDETWCDFADTVLWEITSDDNFPLPIPTLTPRRG